MTDEKKSLLDLAAERAGVDVSKHRADSPAFVAIEKTPPLGTELPKRHTLSDTDRRKGRAASAKEREVDVGPEIEKIQAAPYEAYTEIEITIRGRDGRQRITSPEGMSIGRIKGQSTRRVSTKPGYMTASDRVRLANHLTAFVRHLLEGSRGKTIEQVIDEMKEGVR